MAEVTITGGTQGSVTVSRRELEQLARALANLSKLMNVALAQKQGAPEKRACQEAQGLTAMCIDMIHRWQG